MWNDRLRFAERVEKDWRALNDEQRDLQCCLLVLPSILFGAALTLAIAWMLGSLCLHRLPAPGPIRFAVGAVVESSLVFLLLTLGTLLLFLGFEAINFR